jgi:hypothetical protein
VHAVHQDKNIYVLKNLNSSVFKHITTGNNLKPFHIRTAYTNTNVINNQGTTTSLERNETDNNETNQIENKAAALKAKKKKNERRE